MAFMHSNVEEYRAWSIENPTLEIVSESSVIATDFARTAEPARTILTPTVVESGSTFLPEPTERGLSHFEASLPVVSVVGEKGPAPPCLSYEFLSKTPKITSLVLKKN